MTILKRSFVPPAHVYTRARKTTRQAPASSVAPEKEELEIAVADLRFTSKKTYHGLNV